MIPPKESGDREVLIDGVSFHERWEVNEFQLRLNQPSTILPRLVFRHANVFHPERLPEKLRRMIKL